MLNFLFFLLAGLGIVALFVVYQSNKESFTSMELRSNKMQWFFILLSILIYHAVQITTHPVIYWKLFHQGIFWVTHVTVLWYFAVGPVAKHPLLRRLVMGSLLASLFGLGKVILPMIIPPSYSAEDYKRDLRSQGVIFFAPEEEGVSDTTVMLNRHDTLLQVQVLRRGYNYNLATNPKEVGVRVILRGSRAIAYLTRRQGIDTAEVKVTVGPMEALSQQPVVDKGNSRCDATVIAKVTPEGSRLIRIPLYCHFEIVIDKYITYWVDYYDVTGKLLGRTESSPGDSHKTAPFSPSFLRIGSDSASSYNISAIVTLTKM